MFLFICSQTLSREWKKWMGASVDVWCHGGDWPAAPEHSLSAMLSFFGMRVCMYVWIHRCLHHQQCNHHKNVTVFSVFSYLNGLFLTDKMLNWRKERREGNVTNTVMIGHNSATAPCCLVLPQVSTAIIGAVLQVLLWADILYWQCPRQAIKCYYQHFFTVLQ